MASLVSSEKRTLVAIVFTCFASDNLYFSLPSEYYISNSIAILFLFFCFVCFLIFFKSCCSDSCFFLHSLSVIVLFFRCRSDTEISKDVQYTPGQCPPSMDTTNACFSFHGMWIVWLWDLFQFVALGIYQFLGRVPSCLTSLT